MGWTFLFRLVVVFGANERSDHEAECNRDDEERGDDAEREAMEEDCH